MKLTSESSQWLDSRAFMRIQAAPSQSGSLNQKAVQPAVESMGKYLEDPTQNAALGVTYNSMLTDPSLLKDKGVPYINSSNKDATSLVSLDPGWKSGDISSGCNSEDGKGTLRRGFLKKSQSLGSELGTNLRIFCEIDTEYEPDHSFTFDGFHDPNGTITSIQNNDPGKSAVNQYPEASTAESPRVSSGAVNNGSFFSDGDPQQFGKDGHEDYDTPLSGDGAGDSGDHSDTPRSPPMIVRSYSVPNFGADGAKAKEGSPCPSRMEPRCRSSEDLNVLQFRRKDGQAHEVETESLHNKEGDDFYNVGKTTCENPPDDSCDTYDSVGLTKEWVVPGMDEISIVNYSQGESSFHRWDELPGKDFKLKHIEEWVSDLQHCEPLEEENEAFDANDQVIKSSGGLDTATAAKLDGSVTLGMEVAKKYISSLSATATTAQLANHGLVVIPFVSVFVSLRALNLSGNAIVRITAGALPRGLHLLNLSKNKISAIEGLRELSRLRVLDLSYNRIFRIGHGLASCSSLKELYLAGNKISEVEGLHRLLKLNVLDLRFNKISTSNCLGQLAANYNSLQAISLEGNPAQKNVGDEQLKKYMQGLLPHLTYYNRQPIKASTLKDPADRTVRLGMSSHQFDRGIRADHKSSRKVSLTSHKPSLSTTYGRRSQAVVSPKRSKDKHVRLPPPPCGTKAISNHQPQYFDFSSKLLSLKPKLSSIHNSRSEGNLGAF
ncbi:Leucine-rich repeat [Dillenia turbinata]|uniref:Leucine-rich repeat n=1 Tax=Dillenia turbinata TaxID=194707 RepID=A0AAN8YZL0_9MAGN